MRRLAIFLLLASPLAAQTTITGVTVEPAEWQNMPTPTPTGTRTNAPITFGMAFADAAGIDCPGTRNLPGNEQAPTKLELYYNGAKTSSQMRCVGAWPDGNAEWVLFDTEDSSFSESTGYDSNFSVVQVASGGGNYPATTMAVQCTGSNTPVSGCPDSNHILINTSSATFLVKETNYNLFDDVSVGGTHLVSTSNHGANDGLLLTGPALTSQPPATAAITSPYDSVSCNPGPLPTLYAGSSTCSTVYDSNQDSASTCVIEENGPIKSVLMCQGNLINSSGVFYAQWRTRMYFWVNHSDVKVTVALRNAEIASGATLTQAAKTATFTNATKEFTQFEARLTDNLGSPSSRNWDIGSQTGTLSASNGTDNVFLWQAFGTNGLWPHWTNAPNCAAGGHGGDACVVSPIPRTGTQPNWTYAAVGWQVDKNGSIVTGSGGATNTCPAGWADLDDGTNGIQVGVYQLCFYWPKSLEFQPGTTNHNEIRIGINPNQSEFLPGTTNTYMPTGFGTGQGSFPGSYVIDYPSYSIHDLWFNFHTGTQTTAAAQNAFGYFQHDMLGRPSTAAYWSTAKNSQYPYDDALGWNLPDPNAEDGYYTQLGIYSGTLGCSLGDVGSTTFPYQGSYSGMPGFRFIIYQTAGGADGTQFEQRFSFLRNWLERGGSTNACSVPGRYVWARSFYRLVTEKTIPRADTGSTSGSTAGWRQFLTSLTIAANSGYSPWGDFRNTGNRSSIANGGMENWGDNANSQDHNDFWGAFYYYFLSGDEFVREQLLDGFKDRCQAPFVSYNNLYGFDLSGENDAPGSGHLNTQRMVGHWLATCSTLSDFLNQIGDPDADNSTTMANSPGTAPNSSTAFQGMLQTIAAEVSLPYIIAGYPSGWLDTTSKPGTNCSGQPLSGAANNCSQGISPVTNMPKGAGGGDSCGNASTANPCDGKTNRDASTFQLGIYAEGLYWAWQKSTKILGRDWRELVCSQPGGPVIDGAVSLSSVTLVSGFQSNSNGCVEVGEKQILDRLYAVGERDQENNGIQAQNYTGSGAAVPPYSLSGAVFTQYSDWPNTGSSGSPAGGCSSNADCLRQCPNALSACSPLTSWFGFAAPAAETNTIQDLSGNKWQFLMEAVMSRVYSASLLQELSSHQMEFGLNYILASNASNPNYTVAASVPQLTALSITVGDGTHSGYCVGGAGTCTITWTAPSNLVSLNGTQYRLKYFACKSGVLTVFGNDCPTGGKTIVPTLGWHDDSLTAGTIGTDSQSGIEEGSWTLNPATNQNWAFTENVPDCLPGQSAPSCNSAVPSGSSYTFNTQSGVTYTFSLAAYEATSLVSVSPGSQNFGSILVGNSSPSVTFTLTNGDSTPITMSNGSCGSSVCSSNTAFAVSSSTCTGTISASASCSVVVTFSPTAAGSATATLSFTDSDPSSPQTSSLSGTGLGILPNGMNLTGIP
jgi:hypothetical protein